MSLPEKEWHLEQERVDATKMVIEKKETTLKSRVGDLKEGIISLRKNFWEDVTVNVDEPDDIIETQASIAQRVAVLSERERSHGHMYQQLKMFDRLKDSPYFGRIDFIEEGLTESEPIYIGIASLMDEGDENFLIYDWRAPISSMYYDYSPGPAQYDTIEGIINGEMTLKRQFIINRGQIDGLFDTGVTIGDHMLQEVLGKESSTQMKSIVSTIQKEQNQIIRNERARVLVVQGVAGSGKTSAALQRVAYLLYSHRKTLNAENIVLFSPNPLFNSYVSTVLPELGEENMEQTTFKEFVEAELGQDIVFEDPFQQMEMYLNPEGTMDYDTRMAAVELKSNLKFKTLIDNYLHYLKDDGLFFKDLHFRGTVLFSKTQIRDLFYDMERDISIPNRLTLISEKLLEALPAIMKKEAQKPWVEEAVELLDKDDYLKAFKRMEKRRDYAGESFNDFDQEREILNRMVVKKEFKEIKKQIKQMDFVDTFFSFTQVFGMDQAASDITLKDWKAVAELSLRKLKQKALFWEDVTPFLYFKNEIKGRKPLTSIRHLIIDEAQDYSPFQMAYLKKLFPSSKMTLLGDINQGIYAHHLTSPSVLTGELKFSERIETIALLRSYRSTREIVNFTKNIIAGGDKIEPFNRPGIEPTVTVVPDQKTLEEEIIKFIEVCKSRGHETIAIIGKTMKESKDIYNALKGQIGIQLMDDKTYTFKKGLLVIPAYLAKGIEFDAVMIYDASDKVYKRESERNLFYTACTRAMHELHLFSLGPVTHFVK